MYSRSTILTVMMMSLTAFGEQMVIRNDSLALQVRPDLGGRYTSLVALKSGHEQLFFNPPQGDISDLTHFMELGGWADVVPYVGGKWPGPLWNQPFVATRIDTDEEQGVVLRGEKGPVTVIRKALLPAHGATLKVHTTYRNSGADPLEGIYVFPHCYLLPGGHNLRSAALMPGRTGIAVVRLGDEGYGRMQTPAANWWAVTNPDSRDTVILTYDPAETMELNLYMDGRTFIPQTMGHRVALQPGEVTEHAVTLHHIAADFTSLADAGATWFADGHILSVHAPATVVDAPRKSLPVTLRDFRPGEHPVDVVLRLLGAGTAEREQAVELHDGAATLDLDIADLADGTYALELAIAGQTRGARWPLSVVVRTRQRLKAELSKLRAGYDRLPGGVRKQVIEWDLEAVECLLASNAMDLAEATLDVAADDLETVAATGALPPDLEAQLSVGKDWCAVLDRSVATLPDIVTAPQHFGALDVAPRTGSQADWHYARIAEFAHACAWAYLNPASAHHGKPAVLRRAVSGVDYATRALEDGTYLTLGRGDGNIQRFAMGPLGDAIRLLEHVPVGDARKAVWLDLYRRGVEFQIREYAGKEVPHGGYMNQDVMYLVIMRLAEKLYADPRYGREAERMLDLIDSQLLPDGAFYYLYPHNEVPVYHEIDVCWLGHALTLASDERTRDMIARTVRYYPVTLGAQGFLDGSSACWWKESKHSSWAWLAPTVVAGVSGDAQNRRLAARGLRGRLKSTRAFRNASLTLALYAAPFGGEGPEMALPDGCIVPDRNIKGARGRFGDFCWLGTLGSYRQTHVGASLFAGPRRGWSLEFAGAHVYLQKGNLERRHSHSFDGYRLSPKDYSRALSVSEDHTVLACSYPLQGTRVGLREDFTPQQTPWLLRQLWYFDSQRLVGLLELTATEDAEAYAADLGFWFIPLRDERRENPELVPDGDDGCYRYGDLRVRVWDATGAESGAEVTSLKRWAQSPVDHTDGFFTRAVPEDGHFRKGERYRLLVEVRPERARPLIRASAEREGLAFTLLDQSLNVSIEGRPEEGTCRAVRGASH